MKRSLNILVAGFLALSVSLAAAQDTTTETTTPADVTKQQVSAPADPVTSETKAITSSQIKELKERIIELQNKGTLKLKDFLPCSKIITIGSYEPLKDAKIKQDEILYVYFEPENFFTNKSQERYEIWLTEDIHVLSENGELLMEKPNAVDMHFNSATPILDIYFNNHIEFKGVQPGKYLFKAILYDKLKGTNSSETLPFEVVK